MAVKQYIPAIKYGNLVAGDEIEDGAIDYDNMATGTTFTRTVDSSGTTAVPVFTAGAPVACTVTGVTLVALDTTATNITVENPASTVVCTIAKGTVAGVVVGATTLANTSVAAGNVVIVDGSGAGNARVTITFTKA
jgi:hypothetical protein